MNVSDFTPVKQQVETNTTDISTLKTGKADADGSNINVGSFSAKLNTGKVEKAIPALYPVVPSMIPCRPKPT